MLLDVKLYLSEHTQLYQNANLLVGLSELARAGRIGLEVEAPNSPEVDPSLLNYTGLTIEVQGPDAVDSRIFFDQHDRSDLWNTEALATCDVYFKRCHIAADRDRLHEAARRKILPLGPILPCRTGHTSRLILRSLVGARLGSARRRLLPLIAMLVSWYRSLPDLADFERLPGMPADSVVLFQPRLYDRGETGDEDHEALNGWRVEVLRALRAAFPGRFRGGLVPTPIARSRYPDLLSPLPCNRTRYIRWSKRNLISVSIRGLWGSLPCKVGESLAASQCLVSERFRHDLIVPLREGTHWLGYRTADECVAACGRLLDDAALAQEMRRANYESYLAAVRPDALMARCLQLAGLGKADHASGPIPATSI
jgi:hypothetical protein